jgi:hypothetical protein
MVYSPAPGDFTQPQRGASLLRRTGRRWRMRHVGEGGGRGGLLLPLSPAWDGPWVCREVGRWARWPVVFDSFGEAYRQRGVGPPGISVLVYEVTETPRPAWRLVSLSELMRPRACVALFKKRRTADIQVLVRGRGTWRLVQLAGSSEPGFQNGFPGVLTFLYRDYDVLCLPGAQIYDSFLKQRV